MVSKKTKSAGGKRKRKAAKKAKPTQQAKTRKVRKMAVLKRTPVMAPTILQPIPPDSPSTQRFKIAIENISGNTAIGDLLVAFPRTREVLIRKGLRLEAEDAGAIYMTIDAFSALYGLKTENIVLELVEVAKEPPAQPVVQLAAPPAA